jgi:hypothetical protein
MKRIGRTLLAVLSGFLAAFLVSFAFTEVKQRVLLPYPFQTIMMTLTSGILECFLGGILAGFISRKHGSLLGIIIAYAFVLTTVLVSNWVFSGFSPEVRNEKIYDVFGVNWEILRYSTALFFGFVGGKLGELFSKRPSR